MGAERAQDTASPAAPDVSGTAGEADYSLPDARTTR